MVQTNQFELNWLDKGIEAQCKPNPAFPDGQHLNTFKDYKGEKCKVKLPYPAKRCGLYTVHCKVCDTSIGCTTAGRSDDPRSIVLKCGEIKGGRG